jgi:type IV pilus assembly protein PilW
MSVMRAHPTWSSLSTRQRGVTLVELMVTIAINLVLVLAATLLYLNTRTVQRGVNERSAIFESAQLILELIGREVGNAAFYPSASVETATSTGAPATNVLWSHDMAAKAMSLPVPYLHGVFGCSGQRFNSKDHVCEAHASNEPAGSDALVLSYYTNDAMSLGVGQRADCTRAIVDNDPKNAGRLGTGSPSGLGVAPALPLLVANRYQLKNVQVTTDSGVTINTSSLVCSGNGHDDPSAASPYVELIQGVEQFVVRYGVMNDASQMPVSFMDAKAIVALGDQTIDGVVYPAWQRVVAVQVCLVVRALGNNTALRDATSGQATAITDCNGAQLTPPLGAQMRRFEQTFSVKNRQTNTL